MAKTATPATTELQMVLDAREYLLANGGTPAELNVNQRMIDKYGSEGRSPITAQPVPFQRSGGGDGLVDGGSTKLDRNKPQQPQINFAASLLHRLWAPDVATADELAADLPNRTRQQVGVIIDNLQALLADMPREATPGQVDYLRSLWARKMKRETELDAVFEEKLSTFSFDTAKKMIDQLKQLADVVAPVVPQLAEGMYRDPESGQVYKVQKSRESGKLYAKELVRLDEPVIKRDKEMTHDFVFVSGAIMRIKPEWRMTLEEARTWGQETGTCCNCGALLTDPVSVEAGIGPKCAGRI